MKKNRTFGQKIKRMLISKIARSTPLRFAMIGNGSWATALTKVLLTGQPNLQWFVRDAAMIKYIEKYHRNPEFLRSAQLDASKLEMSDNINEVIGKADVLVFCIPSACSGISSRKYFRLFSASLHS